MNQKNYSRSIPKSSSFNISNQYNNIFYALLIILVVFIIVILINYIYHVYQEMKLKQFGINRVIQHRQTADAYFKSVRQNDDNTQKQSTQTPQTPQNNTESKVNEVNIGGNMIPCDILKPCRLLNPLPKDGCCPNGITAIDKNGPPGNCELGAEYRSSTEYQNALKKCGY